MSKLSVLLVPSLGLVLALSSRANAQEVPHANPPAPASPPAYRQVVTAKPGTIVFVAGQVARSEKGELVGVQSLAQDDWLIEIEVTAVIP
jgi:enamine deaminase RidA (YjgF/YER057c/UK114 family)